MCGVIGLVIIFGPKGLLVRRLLQKSESASNHHITLRTLYSDCCCWAYGSRNRLPRSEVAEVGLGVSCCNVCQPSLFLSHSPGTYPTGEHSRRCIPSSTSTSIVASRTIDLSHFERSNLVARAGTGTQRRSGMRRDRRRRSRFSLDLQSNVRQRPSLLPCKTTTHLNPNVRSIGRGSSSSRRPTSTTPRAFGLRDHIGMQRRKIAHHPLVLVRLIKQERASTPTAQLHGRTDAHLIRMNRLRMLSQIIESRKLLAAMTAERSLARVFAVCVGDAEFARKKSRRSGRVVCYENDVTRHGMSAVPSRHPTSAIRHGCMDGYGVRACRHKRTGGGGNGTGAHVS